MSTLRLVVMMIAWVLASVMIAVVTAILLTEALRAIGVVTAGTAGYGRSINLAFVVVFVALLVVPFAFRRRFTTEDPDHP